MVLGIGVDVEQRCPRRRSEGLEDRRVAPLADVDDAFGRGHRGRARQRRRHHDRQTATARPTRRRRSMRRRSRSDLPPQTP